MRDQFNCISLAVIILLLSGCGGKPVPRQVIEKKSALIELAGNYVSPDYQNRAQGYDWVAVTVKQTGDSTFHLAIRSRIDLKKPTCTFDGDAVRSDTSCLITSFQGTNILFTFRDSLLEISAQKAEEAGILNYFCSGGGSIAGTYLRIKEPLDKKQLDPRVFQKFLSLQNISFDISTTGEGSFQHLTILPYGLKIENKPIEIEIEGVVVDAEIEDLNSDGFPELLIYTCSAGSGSYGNVIGYSVNNGKSLSQIAFPNLTENPQASQGYMGHDQFQIVETSLVQRFRLYKPSDTNNKPTGGYRQIQYKLKEGEASRKFVLDKIEEFEAK